jgi:hypothetical protein
MRNTAANGRRRWKVKHELLREGRSAEHHANGD